MKRINKISLLVISILIFTSCTKVIDITVKDASPRILIQGIITNLPGPYFVHLSKTVSLSETNTIPFVKGALVLIIDKTSNVTDTLIEGSNGIYTTQTIQGLVGHSYELIVKSEGQTYTSYSTMPPPVPFDSLSIPYGRNDFNGSINFSVRPCFQDPAGIANYYTFNEFVNGERRDETFVFDDRLSDGKYMTDNLRGGGGVKIGDTVIVSMNCLDKNAWNYFNTFNILSDGGFESPAPANPTSNINNNALGYFSAQCVQIKLKIVR